MSEIETLDLSKLTTQEAQEGALQGAESRLKANPFLVINLTGSIIDTGIIFNSASENSAQSIKKLNQQHQELSQIIDQKISQFADNSSHTAVTPLQKIMDELGAGYNVIEQDLIKNKIIGRYLVMNEDASALKTMAFFGATDQTLGDLFNTIQALSNRTDSEINLTTRHKHFKTLGDYCFEKGLYENAIAFYGELPGDQYKQKIGIAKFRGSFNELMAPFNTILIIKDSDSQTIKENVKELNAHLDALLASHGSSKDNCVEIRHALEKINKVIQSLKELKTRRHNDIERTLENLIFSLVDKLVQAAYTEEQPQGYLNWIDTLLPEYRIQYMELFLFDLNTLDNKIKDYNKSFVLSHIATRDSFKAFRIQPMIEKFGFNSDVEFTSIEKILNKPVSTDAEATARIKLIDACLSNWNTVNKSAPDNDENAKALLEIASNLAKKFPENNVIKQEVDALSKKYARILSNKVKKPLIFTGTAAAPGVQKQKSPVQPNPSSSSSSSSRQPIAPNKDSSLSILLRFREYFIEKGKTAYHDGRPDVDAKARASNRAARLVKILTRLEKIYSGSDNEETKKRLFLAEFEKFKKTPMDLKIHSEGIGLVGKATREVTKNVIKLSDRLDRLTQSETEHDHYKNQLNGEELWEMMKEPIQIKNFINSFQSFIDWDMKAPYQESAAVGSDSRPKPTSP